MLSLQHPVSRKCRRRYQQPPALDARELPSQFFANPGNFLRAAPVDVVVIDPLYPMQLSLTSIQWQFRNASEGQEWHDAVVPGCVHKDLHRNGLIPDPFFGRNEIDLQWIEERDWDYRANFEVGDEILRNEFVDLVADGLDTVATVRLNGVEISKTDNMFVGYRWPVKSNLRAGSNTIEVRFHSAMAYIRSHFTDHQPRETNDPVGRCTVIRKEQCQFGWDWGPRFVTCGIWQDIRLESWSRNRITGVAVKQDHANRAVRLELAPELARESTEARYEWSLELDGELVEKGSGTHIDVPDPQLWWPNGHGAQPLYTLKVHLIEDGEPIDTWERRIGLRTIRLDRTPDDDGENFRFVVNSRAIFAKGANWIPAHAFVAGLTREEYARDLQSAVAVHMNMIRVWGGGIYESEDFLDLCDELGLLVWHDFMFSCTRYPGSPEFLDLVAPEVVYQARRLRHRACLALWCGNNEIFMINAEELGHHQDRAEAYHQLFHRLIPETLSAVDPVTDYWPSSPHRGNEDVDHRAGEKRGDTHFWDVWHQRHPVSDYQKWRFRFVSEFGMQSFSSPETQATFCPPDDRNVFGATMENHQKNRAGNQIILDYVSRRYRFPKSQDDLLYLSQLNQAHCIETGIEFYRRISPHCMGALYWQLNDCWPVASWSSIEFPGHWRALHYAARRFFAPTLVTAQLRGTEEVTIGNYRRAHFTGVELYTVSDLLEPTAARLFWNLFHLDGRQILAGQQVVTLTYGHGSLQTTVLLEELLQEHGLENVYLRIGLAAEGQPRSEETVFFTPPRFLSLPASKTSVEIGMEGPRRLRLTFLSPVFQHRFAFRIPGFSFHASDNFFELYPNEAKHVVVDFSEPVETEEVSDALRWRSLVDSYAD